MPHTTRKNAREWQRLWRAGEIITEIDGDDPGMPRARPARAEGARLAPWSSRPEVHGRTQEAEPMKLTRLL